MCVCARHAACAHHACRWRLDVLHEVSVHQVLQGLRGGLATPVLTRVNHTLISGLQPGGTYQVEVAALNE